MEQTDLISQYIIACCVLRNIYLLRKDFIDDHVIIERNNVPVIAHNVEINVQGKEEGIQKKNALTYVLN